MQPYGRAVAGRVTGRFQPGQERRDADAARDPHLRAGGGIGRAFEAAVGAFDRDRRAFTQRGGQASGEVAQGLDPVSYTHLDVYKRQVRAAGLVRTARKIMKGLLYVPGRYVPAREERASRPRPAHAALAA